MNDKPVLMLRHAEAAFRECLTHLTGGKNLSNYKDREASLSPDARRLAVFLFARHCFPHLALPVPSGWETIAAAAERIDKKAFDALKALFPSSESEKDRASTNGLADAPTLSEIGFFYERLKDFQARVKNNKVSVVPAHLKRKRSGTYFTPLSVCRFMVEQALDPMLKEKGDDLDRILETKVIDPAMGTGQFLLAAADLLVNALNPDDRDQVLADRRALCARCLYGVELDSENIDVARFLLGLYVQGNDPVPDGLVQGDALIESAKDSDEFGGEGFPEKLFSLRKESFDGFDAIVGNPPYLSAKVKTFSKYKPYLAGATQADFYLLFIQKYAARRYLRPGGGLCMIVPDPLLLRANAESARFSLVEGLDLESLLHIKGIFPRTSVANVIFLARRSYRKSEVIRVARIEKASQVRSFRKRGAGMLKKLVREIPSRYFRKATRKEFRYLLDPAALDVVKRLDTTRPASQDARIVVRSLQTLAGTKAAIFRGEEIGKEGVKRLTVKAPEEGCQPILLGGESLDKYAVRDDGLYIAKKYVKKDLDRYLRHKILLQKSTGRIVAALDSTGYVVPQSVYGILIDDHRIGYPFLLAQLNSRLLSYFMHVMFTGYKMLQPQIEVEDIRQIPVMVPIFEETKKIRSDSLNTAKSLFDQYVRTDDPGWILEYVDDSIKLGSKMGSAMIHDLLDFLGFKIMAACSGTQIDVLPKERLEWLIDLVVYRVFGLALEEIETVERFFESSEEWGAEPDSPFSAPSPAVKEKAMRAEDSASDDPETFVLRGE